MYLPVKILPLVNGSSPVGSVFVCDVNVGFDPQARHQNKIQKVFLRRIPLSRFLAKTLRVNKKLP